MSEQRILVLKAGTTMPEVVAAHGDYDTWFSVPFEAEGFEIDVVDTVSGETLPHAGSYAGVVITGSPSSVRDQAPWMGGMAGWALAVAAAGTPVLGVCFGHQLLGEALGGWVEPSAQGGEFGTITVQLTEAGRKDPLFEGVPDAFRVQSTHKDLLIRPPVDQGAVRLAGNAHTHWQAFAAGPHLRAVQFHPELTPDALRLLLKARGIQAPVSDEHVGLRILQNWLGQCRARLASLER